MCLLIEFPGRIVGSRRCDAERIAFGEHFLASLRESAEIVQVREERLMQSSGFSAGNGHALSIAESQRRAIMIGGRESMSIASRVRGPAAMSMRKYDL